MTDTKDNTGSAAARYAQLVSDRDHFVRRGDKAARLTLPTLFMRDKNPTDNADIKDPTQSLGARGTNTLASKMTLSLLPMNTPFFKLNVNTLKLKQEGKGDEETEVKKGLAVIERGVVRKIENTGDVTAVYEALKHLIVVGNVLMFVSDTGARIYDLNKYVVVRDPQGNILECVICEQMAPATMSKEARALIASSGTGGGPSAEKTVPVYTHITVADGRVKWHQEVEGQTVPGTSSDVPESANPWLALRFMRVDGENYGRGYVEMYMGDLESLEVLTKAVRDAAVASSKVIWLVRPNGSTNPRVIATADNNAVKSGDANDVTALRLDKSADLRVAENMIKSLESRLAFAFMINSEVLRDAERVTAEEVRFVAQELDDSLGGIYSILSKDFQLPYVKRRMHLMRKAAEIPKLPSIVEPVIVTGFAALGRGHDRDKLMRYAETMANVVGKERLGDYIDLDELADRLAVSDGIETENLLVDPEVREAKRKEDQQAAMVQQFGPEVLKQVGGVVQKQAGQQPQPTPEGAV
ncbi:portal protein [Epibacterium sp. MM17-32]|uniref:portal protein n=1 Tax=Epibacterium sp. MM17-32 TaxID=2917734 RepID=UPI001EF6F4AE|nr:portal protein [Epibacterium sp. MM17-32]MCG7628385.1 portal protein [Epibacterium sp. MM17-32]